VKPNDPNTVEDSLILADFKKDIKQRIHFCLQVQSYETLQTLQESFPEFKTKFTAVYPFYSKPQYQEKIIKSMSSKHEKILQEAFLSLRSELLENILSREYIDSLISSENLAVSYENLGNFIFILTLFFYNLKAFLINMIISH